MSLVSRNSTLVLLPVLCSGMIVMNALAAESALSLKKRFADPPAEYRVTLNRPQALDYANEKIAGGFLLGGWFPSPQAKGNIDPAWMDNPKLFKQLSRRISLLKAKGVQLWFYDERGYPSGSAAGRVIAGHPEFAAQILRCRSFESSGNELTLTPEGNVVYAAAFPIKNGVIDLKQKVDLTASATAGKFSWKPTIPGKWRVCLFEHVEADAWKRHDQARQMGNIMDRKATARFIGITHQRLEKELGKQVGDIFLFFTDEPQFNCVEYWGTAGKKNVPPAVPWTDELPIAFKRKWGHPLTNVLPALFNHVGPATGRFRYEFYDVCSDLVAENYWGQIQDWCSKNGTYSSGHMLLEETLLHSVMFNGSVFKNWARADLPGIDLLFIPRYKTMPGAFGKESFSIKMAASIRTFGNKPGVFSESFALCNRRKPKSSTHLRAAKGSAAWQYAHGITHMITFDLQNILTKEEYRNFADYTGRLALLCRRGRPVSDVAVLAPEASVWAFYNPPDGGTMPYYWKCNPDVKTIDTVFNETCYALSSGQRDFEILTEELLGKAAVNKGRLELAGQSFAFLVLPEVRMLSKSSMKKIETFVSSGGRVIFTGSLPSMSPEKGKDAVMRERAEALLASHAGRTRFVEEERRFGETVKWMAKQVPPVIRWDGPDGVRLAHQREPGRDIILVANPSPAAAQGKLVCTFGGNVSIWNPETGEIRGTGKRKSGEAVSVAVPADSARFVVFE